MAILHGGYTFTGKNKPLEVGMAELPAQPITAPGVYGISVLMGRIKGRSIKCEYILDGFATTLLLASATNSIVQAAGVLTGRLQSDGASGVTYDNCVFMGFEPNGSPFYSAGGTVGWVQYGTLHWMQTEI